MSFAQDPKRFGKQLQDARISARITQIELAAQLGFSKTTLSELECGYLQKPAPDIIEQAEKWLETSAAFAEATAEPDDLAERLQAARAKAGLAYEALADQVGVSKSTLQRIEQGSRPTPAVRTAVETWLRGDPPGKRRDFRRLASYSSGNTDPAQPQPLRVFVAYDHTGGPANTIMELPAEPVTIAHIRQMEQGIARSTGHEQVCVRSWQRVGASVSP